jgi:hypothetical protein
MKTSIEIPDILEEQQIIIEWSRKLRKRYISFSTVIEYLVSDKKTQSDIIDDGLDEVRKIYKTYNSSWREQVLLALMIDNYRLENDIREGDIVTDGNHVGYAFNIDYKTRDFSLHSSNDVSDYTWIQNFKMDDFKKI